MKSQLIAIVAAVLVVGCGESQQSVPAPEAKPEPPTAKAPDISIHDAAGLGNIEAVKQHLDAGADVNARNKIVAYTPLHAAAGGGRMEVAELLIAKGADVNAKGHEGWTPLHEVRVKEIAELLIAKGADVNAKLEDGGTPLQIAALRGFKEIAELLIAAGADVNAKEEDGDTPLDSAIAFNQTETIDLLRKHGGKTRKELEAAEPVPEAATPEPPTAKAPDISIHKAAFEGNIEAVKQHLAAGADVNVTHTIFGTTPLHEAATYGDEEIAELLIAAGADVNAKDRGGQTPLDWAIHLKRTETADLLRKHGGKRGEELK